MMNRRQATQAMALAGLHAMFIPTLLPAIDKEKNSRHRGKSGKLAPFKVVHGWPQLPDAYYLGQVAGVGADSQGRIFVFHRGDRSQLKPKEIAIMKQPAVLCIDGKTGKLLNSWGADRFITPHGLRVDSHDNVWVSDIILNQIQKYTPDGKLLMSVGAERVSGCDATHFYLPTDIAVADDGSFYVSDGYGNSRVAKFDADGKFLLDWEKKGDGPGEFSTPHSVLIGPDGRIYVCDRGNDRMQIFTPEGKFIEQWKSPELGRPWGLSNAPDGSIYMVDGGDNTGGPANRSRILRLDLKGNVLESWGTAGRYDGQMWLGHSIAVDKFGDVYVGDVNIGMRVQKWSRTTKACLSLPEAH